MEPRRWIPPVLTLVVGGALAWYWKKPPAAPPRNGQGLQAPSIVIAPGGGEGGTTDKPSWRPEPVRRFEVPNEEELAARVEAEDPVVIGSTVSAYVTEVLVEPGEMVRKDQLLLSLDGKSWTEARDRALQEKDEKRVREAEAILAQLEIRAPADGVVHEVNVLKGDRPPVAMDGTARPMVILFDWKSMGFHAEAPGDLAALVTEGSAVRVRTGDGLVSPGAVYERGEAAADGSIPFMARPVMPPERTPALKGGAAVLVTTGTREILMVPARAVSRRDGRSSVDKVDIHGERVPTFIVLGPATGGGMVEVRSGLGLNESVAVPVR